MRYAFAMLTLNAEDHTIVKRMHKPFNPDGSPKEKRGVVMLTRGGRIYATTPLQGHYPGKEQGMSIETKSMHVTPVGGNVFADLGFEPEEAVALKAESQRIISEELAIKASSDEAQKIKG